MNRRGFLGALVAAIAATSVPALAYSGPVTTLTPLERFTAWCKKTYGEDLETYRFKPNDKFDMRAYYGQDGHQYVEYKFEDKWRITKCRTKFSEWIVEELA